MAEIGTFDVVGDEVSNLGIFPFCHPWVLLSKVMYQMVLLIFPFTTKAKNAIQATTTRVQQLLVEIEGSLRGMFMNEASSEIYHGKNWDGTYHKRNWFRKGYNCTCGAFGDI